MIVVMKKILSVLMSVTCVVTSGIFGNYAGDFSPVDEETVKLTFATISDTHFTNSKIRAAMLELGLYDMSGLLAEARK